MSNNIISSNQLSFGKELRLAGSSMLVGVPVLIGTLLEIPSIIIFSNDTNQTVFLADNTGTTKGITMTTGEKIIVDCVTNKGERAGTLAFVKGVSFWATAPVGTGAFRIGVLTAE